MDTSSLPVNRTTSIPVVRLYQAMAGDLGFKVIGGYQGMGRSLYNSDVNRPGLALSGYLDYFASDRVQILGNTEIHFMERMSPAQLQHRMEAVFSFEIPAFILSRGLRPQSLFLDMCNRRGIPVLQSERSTDDVISRIIVYLADEFSPETVVHATAVDCYGVGMLIVGQPGIGKSETAIELVERGHRLVADDVVILKQRRGDSVYAESTPVVEHHMEIRGVGIIDVKSIYGVGRVRNQKRVNMVVEIEEWNEESEYDRTGLLEEHVQLLNITIPYLLIPVRPGRNIAIIMEVAALNHRLKELGIHPAMELNKKLIGAMGASNA